MGMHGGAMHYSTKDISHRFPHKSFHVCRAAHPAGKCFITAGVAPSKVRTGPAATLGKQNQTHLKSFHKTGAV